MRRIVGEGSGRAHSKAETSVSRLRVPRRLANEWERFEVESKWPSKREPKWTAKSTSNFVERSEEDDCGNK